MATKKTPAKKAAAKKAVATAIPQRIKLRELEKERTEQTMQNLTPETLEKITSATVDEIAIQQYLALDEDKLTQMAVQLQAQKAISNPSQSAIDAAIDLLWEVNERIEHRRNLLVENMNQVTIEVLAEILDCHDAKKLWDETTYKWIGGPVRGPVLRKRNEFGVQSRYIKPQLHELVGKALNESDDHTYRHRLSLPTALMPVLTYAAYTPAISQKILKRAFLDFLQTRPSIPGGEISGMTNCFFNGIIHNDELSNAGQYADPIWENPTNITRVESLVWIAQNFRQFWQENHSTYENYNAGERKSEKEFNKAKTEGGKKLNAKIADKLWIPRTTAFVDFCKGKNTPTTLDERDDLILKFIKHARENHPELQLKNGRTGKKVQGFLRTLMNHPDKPDTKNRETIYELQDRLVVEKIESMPEKTIVICWNSLAGANPCLVATLV